MQENEVSEETALFSGVDLDFYKTYDLIEPVEALSFKVSTFKSIGWPDPFPDDVLEFDEDDVESQNPPQDTVNKSKTLNMINAVEVSRLNYPESRLIEG